MNIRKSTAQQIVESVRDVSGHDINFINTNGIIYASTDPARVGNFHELGLQVIRSGEIQETSPGDHYLGTQPGVNIPCTFHGETIAAIGITGDPEEVRKYAVLAQKIVGLILREHELDEQLSTERSEVDYVIRLLLQGESIPMGYVLKTAGQYGFNTDSLCRIVAIRFFSLIPEVNNLKSAVQQVFEQSGSGIWRFSYPDSYVVIMEEERWEDSARLFRNLVSDWKGKVRIGVGGVQTLSRAKLSYEEAQIALNTRNADKDVAIFDLLDLEILLGSIQPEVRERYIARVASGICSEDRLPLLEYFAHGMSLKQTAEACFMHKNSVQYRLDRVARNTGYDPRHFPDAVVLYLALRLKDEFLPTKEMLPDRKQEDGVSGAPTDASL